MANNPTTTVVSHNAEAAKEFFNQWSLYRRVVENDYLYHRSVRESLKGWLDALDRPFSFLDLGCGDAAFSSELLEGRAVTSYTGMDLSPVALELAVENMRKIEAPVSLLQGDFMMEVASLPSAYDIIYIGLSLHHLLRREKEFFFEILRSKLAPHGYLLIFDPVLSPGEGRTTYIGRWVDHAQWTWRALNRDEIRGAVHHVTTSDFPEEIGTLNRMAISAGFKPARILFMDRTDFYALMAFQTP